MITAQEMPSLPGCSPAAGQASASATGRAQSSSVVHPERQEMNRRPKTKLETSLRVI